MAKKGKLSKVETSYIETHLDLGNEAIAKDLGRSVQVVEKYVNTHKVPIKPVEEYVPPSAVVLHNQPPPEPTKTETSTTVKKEDKYALSQVEGLFARREGITMMTPAAAEACDEHRDKCFTGKSKFSNAITTVKNK